MQVLFEAIIEEQVLWIGYRQQGFNLIYFHWNQRKMNIPP